MKNLVLTMAVTLALTATMQAQECKPQQTDEKVERPFLIAGGGDKGNGGFVFSRTSGKLLELAQNSLLTEINELVAKRSELVYQSEKCRKPIDLKQLKVKIANVDSDFENRATSAINPEGKREERFFHINKCGNVEAARLYFEVFVAEYFKYQESKNEVEKDLILNRVRNPIIHEALHDFGYDELEARTCSDDLNSVLESYSASKLKRAQEVIMQKNIQETKNFLISSQCFEGITGPGSTIYTGVLRQHGSAMFTHVAHRTLYCLSEKTTLKKENANQPIFNVIVGFGNVIYSAKTFEQLAEWLNSNFKFDFEQAIPTQK